MIDNLAVLADAVAEVQQLADERRIHAVCAQAWADGRHGVLVTRDSTGKVRSVLIDASVPAFQVRQVTR